ncbi:MAG TPA: AbrB/MazE/SpoVT family DNA-binding domain-containing protein [Candidatus Lokiarchaeia archaeon]|nr:AbrB/MazE/SpoVT family DNA-binding domain-containing protein [Candidatus Lokiarchaeia archaeon]
MTRMKNLAINEKGMVTIPYQLRKRHNLHKGTEVAVVEIDGNITIIPIMSKEEFEKSRTITLSEMEKAYNESYDQEVELEK